MKTTLLEQEFIFFSTFKIHWDYIQKDSQQNQISNMLVTSPKAKALEEMAAYQVQIHLTQSEETWYFF